jgi:hypothetical protein
MHYKSYVYINLVVLVGPVESVDTQPKRRNRLRLDDTTSLWIDVDGAHDSHALPETPITSPQRVLKMRAGMRTACGVRVSSWAHSSIRTPSH